MNNADDADEPVTKQFVKEGSDRRATIAIEACRMA
jgi:hypothetical protein